MKTKLFKLDDNDALKNGNISSRTVKVVDLSNFLVCLFDFSFVLFICPFRLVGLESWESSGDKFVKLYIAKHFLPHQIVCAIFSSLSAIGVLNTITSQLPGNSKNPPDYILFMNNLLYSAICGVIFRKWWMESELFARIATFLSYHRRHLPHSRNTRFTSKFFVIAACILYTSVSFTDISSTFDNRTANSTVFEMWLKQMTYQGKKMFLLSTSANFNPQVEQLLGVLAAISILHT